MKRKIESVFFVVLLMMSVFVGLNTQFLFNAQAELNPPHDDGSGNGDLVFGDGIWATDGDWIIEPGDTLTYSSSGGYYTIIVNGNLIVQPGGSLTLENVTLQMNPSFNGEFNITVESDAGVGGTLVIRDLDGDPQTNSDTSIITSFTEDGAHRFGFKVLGPHGDLKMNNSELHECGWDSTPGIQYQDAGLWIGSSNITISGNYISDCYNGITIYGAVTSNVVIQNNNISYCDENGTFVRGVPNIMIHDNEYYRCVRGLDINSSSDVVVSNNHFNEIYGMGAYFGNVSNIDFNHNTIENQLGYALTIWVGVFFGDFCSNIKADHNILHNMPYSGMMAFHYTGYVELTNNTFDDFSKGTGLTAYYGDNAFFYRNSIGKNKTMTGFDDTVSYWIGPITGYAYVVECEGYNNERWSFSNWGTGVSVWGAETVILKDNLLSDNQGSGAYLIDCGNISVQIEGNLMENNGLGLGLSEPSNPPSFGGVKNANVNNNTINNNVFGIYSDGGSNQKFVDNILDGNTEGGITIGVDGTYLANNVISNFGNGDWEKQSGISIRGNLENDPIAENIVLYNNTIYDSFNSGTYPVNGIYLEKAHNVSIIENILNNNEIGISAFDSIQNVLVENSTVTDGLQTDFSFKLATNSNITTLNTTFDNSSTDVDSTSELTVKWYLHVKVLQGGLGVNGAKIWVNDSTGSPDPSAGQPFTTKNIDGENGWVKWIPVTEYIDSNNVKDYKTPHEINATYSGAIGKSIPIMWKNQDVIIDLTQKPVVQDLTAPPYFLNRTETIYFFANGSDLEDTEDMLTPFFEYRDSNDAAWNTTFLGTPLWDATGQRWYISFTPPAGSPTGWYDIKIRFQDTSGSYSNWYILWDSVLVENSPPYVEGMFNISFGVGPSGSLYRGEHAWIYADGEDLEDGDDQNFSDVEFQYKRPGEPSWGTHTAYWQPNTPSMGGSDWYQNFLPAASIDTPLGVYGFRARFQDSDGTWGEWEHLENITVLNNPPVFVDFNKQADYVYRGDKVRVYVDASDVEEIEGDLTVHIYYKHSVTGILWEDTWLTSNGNWDGFSFYADFNPPYTAELGMYEFMVEITDKNTTSEAGITRQEFPAGTGIDVRNNLPMFLDMKPSAPTVIAESGFIYIHVNATDLEDLESLLVLEVEWRYNETSPGTWETAYLFPASYSFGYLRMKFEPDGSMQEGHYDFRARVQDLDAGYSSSPEWIYIYQAVEVLHSETSVIDITIQANEVFRNGSFNLTINATDSNDFENELKVYIEYSSDGIKWNDYNGTFVYVDTNSNLSDDIGYWEVQFNTDINFELGDYDFRCRVENVSNISSGWVNAPWPVNVKNNPPEIIDVISSKNEIRAGVETVYIHVNATDIEDLEEFLKINRIEWRENNSETGNPPVDIWHIDSNKISINLDEGYTPGGGGYIKASMTPTFNAYKGRYDIRVRVEDVDGDVSYWIYLHNAFEVIDPEPILEDITLQHHEVFRGDTVFITLNATDSMEAEQDLTVEIQYKKQGSSTWTDIIVTAPMYNPTGGGYWEIPFSPGLGWADGLLGLYEFHARVNNGVAYSNGGTWIQTSNSAEVKNNIPEAISLGAENSTVERGSSVLIYAKSSDREKPESDLVAIFEFSSDSGTTWESLSGEDYNIGQSRWEVEFTPEIDDDLGEYDFRVRFGDGNDYSDNIREEDLIIVTNAIPIVNSFMIDKDIIFRLESATLSAIVFDLEQDGSTLDLTFEFKGPSGGWVSHEISDYFEEPNYIGNGQWEIIFSAPGYAELGTYSFRVSFTDDEGATSDWMELNDSLILMNDPPQIDRVIFPPWGHRNDTMEILVDVSDSDSPLGDLIPTFEYKAPSGSWISYEVSDSYFSNEPEYKDGEWRIAFTPPMEAELGYYSFRVRFSDDINISDWKELLDSYNLLNDPPQIDDITVPSTGKRLEPIDLFIDITDPDSPSKDLILSIEYKSLSGQWISYEDIGSYFTDNPEYVGGQWRIALDPPAGAELGNYSFRVKVSDGDNETQWFTMTDTFLLIENPLDPDDDGLKNDVDPDDDGDGVLDTADPDPLDPSITKEEATDPLTNFLLLFIIFLIIIIIIILITKKKGPKDILKDDTEHQDDMKENTIDEEPTEEIDETQNNVEEPEDEPIENLEE